jgi:NADH dehydrogenase/NADH:ubiquinone oxidoreductase subunit G
MNIEIEVNGKMIKARKGEMILDALNENGIHVPTLCHLEGFKPSGACRICVVEAEGRNDLIPACSFPVEEWMKIKTHSARVIQARRTILELLLTCHSGGCINCDKNQTCELQELAAELNITEHRYIAGSRRKKLDVTSPSILRDPTKCVLCGRCVRVCEEIEEVAALDFLRRGSRTEVGTVLDKGLNYSSCINCGQCILVCPTGALQEKSSFDHAVRALQEPGSFPVALIDPALAVTMNEWFGHKPGLDFTNLLATALKRIGFRKVYSSAWGNEYETGLAVDEFFNKRKDRGDRPLFLSGCPAFVRYVEQSRQDLLPDLLPVRPGRQIMTHLLRKQQEGSMVFYLTACTAAKSEIQSQDKIARPSFYPDFVLTGREVYKLIRLFGIRMEDLSVESQLDLFGAQARSGYLHAVTGGYLEAGLRIIQSRNPGTTVPHEKITKLKGLKDVKECSFELNGENIHLAAIGGIGQFEQWMKESASRKKHTHLIEVMACPNGCINGGGQPMTGIDRNLRARVKAVGEMDDLYSGVETREKMEIPFDFTWEEDDLTVKFGVRSVIR